MTRDAEYIRRICALETEATDFGMRLFEFLRGTDYQTATLLATKEGKISFFWNSEKPESRDTPTIR